MVKSRIRALGRSETMRREWDARARKDAFFYIASWRKDWDASGFLRSGDEDYKRLVTPILRRYEFSPQGKTILELGCGAGRMTQSFAAHFGQIVALDVSQEMLDRAQQMLRGARNITWVQANGLDLSTIASESVDFAFSYLVLQHLPAEELVRGYIRELLRVLKVTGLCLFQFNGMKSATMNWKGTVAWGCVDALWAIHLPALSRSVALLLGFDPEMAGKSWHGTALSTQSVVEAVNASGSTILELWGEDTAMAWCCARKTRRFPEDDGANL